MSDSILIPISKAKIKTLVAVHFIIAIVSAGGLYYFSKKQDENQLAFQIAAIVMGLIFLIIASTHARKLKERNAGILMDVNGIHDNTSAIGVGLVDWKDIKDISRPANQKDKTVVVQVKNPDKYIKTAKNGAVKRLLEQNIKLYDSPIVLNAKFLSLSFEELEEALINGFERFGKKR